MWLFMKDINNLLRNRFELILNLIENWNWIIYEFNVSKFENRLFFFAVVKNSIYMTAAYCRNLAIDWLLNIRLGASEIDHLAKVKPFKALIHSAK